MDAIANFLLPYFNPVVYVFAISNMLMMGLQVTYGQMFNKMKDLKFLAVFLGWGWIVGPALALLIILILPMDAPYQAVLLMTSLAPSAPFLALMVIRAKGHSVVAGVFIPLATICTVIFMPLISPLMVKGVEMDALTLAKPLVITILIPLLLGTALKTYAAKFADKIFKPVKALAGLSTLVTIALCLLIFAKPMIATAGSFAMLSITIFMIVMGLLAYFIGFGMKHSEKTVMSLGMGTRNITAALLGVYAIPNADPRMLGMVVIWTLWSFVLSLIFAPIYARKAGK